MLPSTGYFKSLNCPFYDSGLCERPYCHFRHVKKDSIANTSNDGIESGAILQKLVSAAVHKVLLQTESSSTLSSSYLTTTEEAGPSSNVNVQAKATYNPTPIAELNKIVNIDIDNVEDIDQKKKHIPVPYTPRKPANLAIKRPIDTNGSSKPFVYMPPQIKYTPGCSDTVQLDPYTPKGSIESNETYLPGTGIESEVQEYTPNETQVPSKHNYIPSDKNYSKKKILEYKPAKVKTQSEMPSVTYQPTPKSLVPCFSSDEEPDTKKVKLNDLNNLDDLGPEFDILDEILDDEIPRTSNKEKIGDKNNVDMIELSNNKEIKEKFTDSHRRNNSSTKKHKSKTEEEVKKISDNKTIDKKVDYHKKHKSSARDKEKQEIKKSDIKSTSKKNDSSSHHPSNNTEKESSKKSHKSSSKSKEERKDKERKSNSDLKRSEKSSNNPKTSKKSFSRDSKHSSSSSSKHNSKRKEEDKKRERHKSSKEKEDRNKKRKEILERSNDLTENDNNIIDDDDDVEIIQNEEEIYELSESDEESIALECKRIFEEYVPVAKSTNSDEINNSNELVDNGSENEYIPGKKRISRTADKNLKVIPKAPLKPDYKVSAAQTMAERLVKVKEFHSYRNPIETNGAEILNPKPDSLKNSKIRIAHVPYASTLISAKKTIKPNSQSKSEEPSSSSTVIQTIKKGTQRVAHIPNEKFIDRPGVLEPLASRIPANIRSTYLNMMIDECLKIYLSAVDAYARAQHEELTTSRKCSTVQIYKNSAVMTISRLRKELQECNGVKKSGSECSALQKMPQTVSGTTKNITWSIENKNRRIVDTSKEFSGPSLYNNLKKWILTEQQLQENGFPRPHTSGEKGRAIIQGQNKKTPPKGYIRTCCRCKKEYTVDKKGFPAIKEECIYHPNNKYRVRGEVKYQCCSQDSSSDGCCIAPCHVYEYVDFENLKGYIRTMPPDSKTEDYGVYSLDCEMCYTTHGLDLTRVTVINSACKVVYETLIKPLHPIIDYNTRYSGITEEHMANVKTTLLEVQATLLSMFNSKTILIGHSLESDFKALKLIHDSVIDTSVLFPHKMGPPYKRALRNLSSEYLKKIIQNSVDGHDSAEDATVCMELVIYKLKEDLKTR